MVKVKSGNYPKNVVKFNNLSFFDFANAKDLSRGGLMAGWEAEALTRC
jgi:hypothetical protein